MTKVIAMLAVIGGTGMDQWPGLEVEREIAVETPYGTPSAPIVVGRFHGVRALFLARHGKAHAIAPHRINYRANIDALARCGASTVVAVAAVGAIAPILVPGSIGVPADLVDYTWGRSHTFGAGDPEEGEAGALRHIEFTAPYSERVRRELLHAALARGVDVMDGGVLGVTQGPRLETAAEIDRLERDGADVVGMTGMPEAALARELDLEYACLALVANFAAGCGDEAAISIDEIFAHLAAATAQVPALLDALLRV